MMGHSCRSFASLAFGILLSTVLLAPATGAKVKRVKAGKQYEPHTGVHIVVNKVG